MRIVVQSIDKSSLELRGFTPTPSFKVQFQAAMFEGGARLVPFSGLADALAGDEFSVEISQETVSGLRLCDPQTTSIVEPLSVPGDFKVRGQVRYVMPCSEPAGRCYFLVEVGDADFSLSDVDLDGLKPEIGDQVEFVAHDLTFWDESL